jgi:hypothetical protein
MIADFRDNGSSHVGHGSRITDHGPRIKEHYENVVASGIAAITSVELSSMNVTEVNGTAEKTY